MKRKEAKEVDDVLLLMRERDRLVPLEQERYSTEYLLIALAKQNTYAAESLIRAGFSIEKAEADLQLLKGKYRDDLPSPPAYTWGPGWWAILELARSLSGMYKSEKVIAEHVLLAIIYRHRSGAFEMLGRLRVNRDQLKNELQTWLHQNAQAQPSCD